MSRRHLAHRLAALVAAWLLAPAAASADPPALPFAPKTAAPAQPSFQFGSKEEAAELDKADRVEWKMAAQGGLILTTGNSRVTTFALGVTASRKANRNKFSFEAAAAYARSRIDLAVDENADGMIQPNEVSRPSQTTTRSWLVKGRYDRYLTSISAVYGAAAVSADEPAGKELVGSGQVGYSHQLFQSAVHRVVLEAGYDLTYEDQVVGDGVAIHSLRGFAGYTGTVAPNVSVEATAEALSNVNHLDTPAGQVDAFEDNRVNGKLSLTTTLFRDISFRVAFEAHYDHAPAPRPPFAIPFAEGFRPLADELDTKTEATLIINFL